MAMTVGSLPWVMTTVRGRAPLAYKTNKNKQAKNIQTHQETSLALINLNNPVRSYLGHGSNLQCNLLDVLCAKVIGSGEGLSLALVAKNKVPTSVCLQ